MSSNQPGRPSRRSRAADRAPKRPERSGRPLTTASTRGSGLGANTLLLAFTGVAIVGAIALIAFAALTGGKASRSNGPLPGLQKPGIVTPADVPADGRTLGKADAKVTLDLWSDFQCPNCGTFARTYEPELVEKYVKTGVMKLVYHHFTVVDQIVPGTESEDSANASWCAQDQGKFWLYHDYLYANQYGEGTGAYTKDRLIEMGQMAGLDMAKFRPCVENNQHRDDVRAESGKTPVNGTPGIIVNGVKVNSAANANAVPSLDEVKAAIDKAASGS